MTDRPLTLERTASLPSSRRALEFSRGLWDLTKPGIIGLLLVTTVPTMLVAADGWPRGSFGEGLVLILLTLLGGILTAGGANTFNQWFDRDIDAIMERTAGRPLPAGVVQPWQALTWGVLLATLGGIQLALTVNLLAALLAEAAVLFYVLVYTVWLKRSTTQNIVIGGAAGSIPPLVGWAAVTGEVTWTPFILFLVIFMWTPPHFWALALKYREDYARADVPMLPVVSGERETRKQLMIYSVGLVAVSLLGPLGGHLSWCYLTTCAISGAAFIWIAWQVWRNQAPPMRLFFASIAYLFIVFAAVGLDVLV
ncbi:MAG: heme o synthase [Chloroflexi bacterium]|nr:heme o synthase [Chloroflexota bacterium]MCY3589810.1 heme o synthase [Chloroflexota bacterium]MCY3685932.1 heme o synthase [Chloroflexota bacterium]MDE2709700.1 heme o synthase [Chloroflexota bacterium]